MIELKDIYKKYSEASRESSIFEGMDLRLEEASKNLILGSSGSGKSTFLNLISALDDADSGSIIIDGVDITKLNQTDKTLFRRKNIGFIFQFFNLIPTLSVKDNIFLPLELNNINYQENQERVLKLLEIVGLLDRQNSMPETLSGGEQQRVAIVRALAHQPRIIIADEPTGNLDKETAQKIIDLINNLIRESKAILVMATHDESLSSIADNIYTVKDKRLEKR